MQSNNSKRSRASWGVFAAFWAVLALAAGGGASAAPVETVLHSFTGCPATGAFPSAGLIADRNGQSLWYDSSGRRVGTRHGVQALAGRDRDGALLLLPCLLHRRVWSPWPA